MAKKKKADRKRGRPELPKEAKRGAGMGFRPTPTIRSRLEGAAERNDRSLSQEIESRLEWSFQFEDLQKEAFGGAHNYVFVRGLTNAIALIEATSKKNWYMDRGTFEAVKHAAGSFLEHFAPPEPDTIPTTTIKSPGGLLSRKFPWDKERIMGETAGTQAARGLEAFLRSQSKGAATEKQKPKPKRKHPKD